MKKQKIISKLLSVFFLMLALVAGITAEAAPAGAAGKKAKLSIKLNSKKLSLKIGLRHTLKESGCCFFQGKDYAEKGRKDDDHCDSTI